MAVVQISRIQLRRGKKNAGTGLPQLASGELAWCIDTQELFVGNGSVGEGAPAVGNTKLITESDNLLDLGMYVYKSGDPVIQTGTDVNFPTERTLQVRLDDYVNSADYGIISSSTDQTEKLKRVIENLFLENAYAGVKGRVVLTFQPGTYTFNQTIYLPSYARIEGAGKQHTIFNYTGTGTAFAFVNDTSTPSSYQGIWNSNNLLSTISTSTYNNQPKNCYLKGFTITTTSTAVTSMQLNAVRDSVFEDLEITGTLDAVAGTNIGIGMYSYSSVVTCQRNIFSNVTVKGFNYSVYAKQDIINNKFLECSFVDCKFGIGFGVGANGSTVGQQFGPRKNTIENCYFENIYREGIYINVGYDNKSNGNTFVNVGNNGAGNVSLVKGLFSQIKFDANGNSSTNENFDRADPFVTANDLASNNYTSKYIKEVSGKGDFITTQTKTVALDRQNSFVNIIRIPYVKSSSIEIYYTLESSVNSQMRRGKISVAIDADSHTCQLVDDYEYIGPVGELPASAYSNSNKIQFKGLTSGTPDSYTGAGILFLQFKNTNAPGDISYLTYSHRSIS